jgi:D-aspartate ligase
MNTDRYATPLAVVVGACAHGLAVIRGLARSGVQVVALESNRKLPGTHSRYADMHYASDINGDGLIDALIDLHHKLAPGSPPVLMLTNDRMVKTVASHWPRLARLYRLSWATHTEATAALLLKSNIEAASRSAGLNYPASHTLNRIEDTRAIADGLEFPLIVKPVAPLSGFKVLRANNQAELEQIVQRFAADLPFVVQEWIDGSDSDLFFAALYLRDGKVLARYEGQKLLSSPPAMGHTVAAQSVDNDEIHAIACRFFAPFNMSGPMSLELKRGPDDRYWIIEPTVGRTDFWIDCCIANGVNLSLLEYLDQSDQPCPAMRTEQRLQCLVQYRAQARKSWFWYLPHCAPRAWLRRPRFTYLCADDPQPFFADMREELHIRRRRLFGGQAAQ